MALGEEKPLLKVGGKPMIEHVLMALKDAKRVDEIVVVVSKHTPKTTRFIKRFPVQLEGSSWKRSRPYQQTSH
jgi:GTP:adenosylcobinamide-phosphate guanylyltransferase